MEQVKIEVSSADAAKQLWAEIDALEERMSAVKKRRDGLFHPDKWSTEASHEADALWKELTAMEAERDALKSQAWSAEYEAKRLEAATARSDSKLAMKALLVAIKRAQERGELEKTEHKQMEKLSKAIHAVAIELDCVKDVVP